MRILHWDEMFHPDFGYQINILPKFQVKQGHEVIIMSPDRINEHPKFSKFANSDNIQELDKEYTEKFGVKIIRLPWYRVVSGRVIYKNGFIKEINKVNPDIIFCHTNDTLSSMIIAINHKKIAAPLVFDNHMLEIAAKNPLRNIFRFAFRKLITPKIIKNNWIVIRTQNDNYVNKCLGVPEYLTRFISFGSDTSLFFPSKEVRKSFRKEHKISEDDFVIVYTGKLDSAKGGILLANTIKEKFRSNKSIVFIIVGNSEGEYGRKVDEIFKETKNRILRFPTQKYVDLPKFYQAADLCIFAKQCSLSFYDAQACGLPVLAENININIERLKHNNGFTFRSNDINDFRNTIQKCIELDSITWASMSKDAYNYVKDEYSYENIAKEYTEILMQEYQKRSN